MKSVTIKHNGKIIFKIIHKKNGEIESTFLNRQPGTIVEVRDGKGRLTKV